jgi:glyoxylate reductase
MANQPDGRLRVFVASTFLDAVREELSAAFEIHEAVGDDPLAAIAASSLDFDAVLFSLDVRMDAARIEALPETVRALATYSVGTDHIDLEAARRRGIAVFNTPGVLADSVAENALFLMLGAARRATESAALLRSRQWTGWTPTQLVGVQLGGRRLGILGMGDIGRRIATRSAALGMEISYCNRRPVADPPVSGARFVETPAALVAESDVLMIACPSTAETRGLVDAELLACAKPGLLVVNIARGDIVVDDALLAALEDGGVLAAGLDVFAGEPDIDPRYFERPDVFMMPHIGSSTIEARLGMGRILIDALARWQAREPVANRVV